MLPQPAGAGEVRGVEDEVEGFRNTDVDVIMPLLVQPVPCPADEVEYRQPTQPYYSIWWAHW